MEPTNAQILGQTLETLMKQHGIPNAEFAIIAGYCLKHLREITDLDVIVSKEAYNKLKRSGLKVGTAKISNTEKLYVSLSESLEIELFEREHTGFPSDQFSLRNMQKVDGLVQDEFGNPYMKPELIVQYYKVYQKDGKFWNWDHEISEERYQKNLNHIKLILTKSR